MLKQEIINFINENQNILNDASDKIWDLAEIKFSVEKSSDSRYQFSMTCVRCGSELICHTPKELVHFRLINPS